LLGRIREQTGATQVRRGERIQSLWRGYGEVVRFHLTGADQPSVVVKHVRPPKGSGRSHSRKLRSYEVEQTWYQDWASRCGDNCRVPACIALERGKGEWLFVLEDLDASGYPGRGHSLSDRQNDLCVRWLAGFHATFLGDRPRGLWKIGTYWHLATRPDELQQMPGGALRGAAKDIDARLGSARFQTLVHGDAKPANFCFSANGRAVAAVDFQYVGGGCGMKDLAYFCSGESRRSTQRLLDVYFSALRQGLSGRPVDAAAVEAEWRSLYAWACADFQRFMAGWSPGWRDRSYGQELTRQVLARR
jgi:hypothetical protein